MATLTTQQTRKLLEITTEIELLEYSYSSILTLGQSNSAVGVSTTYADMEKIRKRLNDLRTARDCLEAIRDDLPIPLGSTGILKINYWSGV